MSIFAKYQLYLAREDEYPLIFLESFFPVISSYFDSPIKSRYFSMTGSIIQGFKYNREVKPIKKIRFLSEGCRKILFKSNFNELVLFIIFFVGLSISILVVTFRNLGDANVAPYDNFLTAPISRFGDFYAVQDEWNRFGWSGVGYGVSYFPAMYLFVEFMDLIEQRPQPLVILYLLSITLSSIFLVFKILNGRSVRVRILYSIMLLLSYPMMLMYSTGNLEGIVLVLVLAWLQMIYRKKYYLASIFLGLAVSIKLVPIVFVFSLINRLEKCILVKTVLVTGFVALATNIVALLILPTGLLDRDLIFLSEIIQNIRLSQQKYADLMYFSESGTHFGHSFLNGIHAYFGENVLPSKSYWLPVLICFSLLFLMSVGVEMFARPSDVIFTKLLLSSAILACLAVPTSTDYKLWYFFIPLLSAARHPNRGLGWLIILSSTVLFAKPYLYSGVQPWANATAYITPLTLLIILFLMLFSDFKRVSKFFASRANFKDNAG